MLYSCMHLKFFRHKIPSTYRVAGNFCWSFILRIGDFVCFAGTNFCGSRDVTEIPPEKFHTDDVALHIDPYSVCGTKRGNLSKIPAMFCFSM